MTQADRQEIITWLQGARNHAEGVALYKRHGLNLMLRRRFALEENATTKMLLIEELRKLAGLSVAEFKRLPRLASKLKPEDVKVEEHPSVKIADPIEVPETIKKAIRFRERFTFLDHPECPDVLKVLVADMFTALGKYKEAFARLQQIPDEEAASAAEECRTVVESYLENREIWDELEHYQATGKILGKCAKLREVKEVEELTKLSDIELVKKIASARTNISKRRKAVADAADDEAREAAECSLAEWESRKAALENEVERRKKN